MVTQNTAKPRHPVLQSRDESTSLNFTLVVFCAQVASHAATDECGSAIILCLGSVLGYHQGFRQK